MEIQKTWSVLLLIIVLCIGCSKNPEQQIAEQLELGQKYLLEENYEQAIVVFGKVIELDPKSISAYIGKIEAYMGQKDYESAISTYKEGIASTENESEFINIKETLLKRLEDLAAEMMKSGSMDRAEQYYDLILQLDDISSVAFLGRAELLLLKGEFDRAEELLQEGLEKVPNDEKMKEKKEQFVQGVIKDYKNRILKQVWHNPDGRLRSYNVLTYDDKKGERKCRFYNSEGELQSEEIVTYGQDGRTDRSARYAADGHLMNEGIDMGIGAYRTTWYNQDGTIKYYVDRDQSGEKTYSSDGTLTSYTTREYDGYGRLIRWNLYSADGTLDKYWISDYDEEGNRINYIEYSADGSVCAYLEER